MIAITAGGSELSRIATLTLAADVQEDPDVYAPMSSRIVHLTIIDALSVGVALAAGPSCWRASNERRKPCATSASAGFGE